MEKQIVQIESITIAELTDIISEKLLERLEDRISAIIEKNYDDKLLTREEAANLLKINTSTLWNWTKKGKLITYGIGNRVYYKRGEVMKAIVPFIRDV